MHYEIHCSFWSLAQVTSNYNNQNYKDKLVGGWTNPFEKYDRQNGFIFPK